MTHRRCLPPNRLKRHYSFRRAGSPKTIRNQNARFGLKSIMQEQARSNQKDRTVLWILVSLCLVLVGDIGACLIKTDGGNVEVVGFRLPGENGQWIAADLFKPKIATEETPVPLVVVCP